MLTLLCKSIAKDHKIEVENLRDDVPDEVIDVDMAKIDDFSTMMHGSKFKGEVYI